jgi:hypothetical protein
MEIEKRLKEKSWLKIVSKAEKIYDAYLSWENLPMVPFSSLNPHAKTKWIHVSLGKTRDSLDREEPGEVNPKSKPAAKPRAKRSVKKEVLDSNQPPSPFSI